jgi:hypothetical protein
MRGADGNPHQVRLEEARAVELAGNGVVPMGVAPAVLDVAPNRDLFVPFEFPVAELTPGWYSLECHVAIDGSPVTARPGSRFAVPWPRGSTRRDQVSLGKSVAAEAGKVRLERLECASDSIQIRYEGGAEPSITLAADGARLPVLETSFDDGVGAGSVTAYPLLKSHRELAVTVKGADAPVAVHLP